MLQYEDTVLGHWYLYFSRIKDTATVIIIYILFL